MTATTDQQLGDPLPAALDRYYRSLDGGDPDAAASSFTIDAIYAVPAEGSGETDARSISEGRASILERFRDRGARSWDHEVTLCTATATDVLVEGVARDRSTGDIERSFAATAQLDAAGLLSRYLAFSSTPISLTAIEANPGDDAPGSAIDKIHEYFDALDASEFEQAAACFSADTVYSHPPYSDPEVGGTGRAHFVGRDELIAAFGRRGSQPIDHRIVLHEQRGPHLLLEGIVNDADGELRGTFVSEATLDEDGLIRRYASFFSQPGVPRR